MSVAQIEHFSAKELAEWRAYDQLDPIGGYRQDIQTAFMAYMAYGDKKTQTINDWLIIDPEPMSHKLKEQAKIAQQKLALERQTAHLIAGFDKVKV